MPKLVKSVRWLQAAPEFLRSTTHSFDGGLDDCLLESTATFALLLSEYRP